MIRTSGEIAQFVGAELEGDSSLELSGVASPERAGVGDLIYVDSPRHAGRAQASAALVVVAPAGVAVPGKVVLAARDPKLAFAKAAAWILKEPERNAVIHPTVIVSPSAQVGRNVSIGPYAVIEDDAKIGADSTIGAFCFLGRGASLGPDCRLHPRVTLYSGVRLGSRVEVHSGVVIGSDGFGYVFGEGRQWKFPQAGGVEIGDDVEIGANTAIDRGSLETTRIADGVKIDNLVQIAHNVQIGEHSVVAAQTGVSGSSVIGKRVVVAGQVGIADHCHVDDGAVVGAQAGIPTGKTIRKGQTVWGTPARPLDRFKHQYAAFSRLPELAERVHRLEQER